VEAEAAAALDRSCQEAANGGSSAGGGGRNYINMLLQLLRLRQACNHPWLVKGSPGVPPAVAALLGHAPPAALGSTSGSGGAAPGAGSARASSGSSSGVSAAEVAAVRRLAPDSLAALQQALAACSSMCGACGDVPEDPSITRCCHSYCRTCIVSCLEGPGSGSGAGDCGGGGGAAAAAATAAQGSSAADGFAAPGFSCLVCGSQVRPGDAFRGAAVEAAAQEAAAAAAAGPGSGGSSGRGTRGGRGSRGGGRAGGSSGGSRPKGPAGGGGAAAAAIDKVWCSSSKVDKVLELLADIRSSNAHAAAAAAGELAAAAAAAARRVAPLAARSHSESRMLAAMRRGRSPSADAPGGSGGTPPAVAAAAAGAGQGAPARAAAAAAAPAAAQPPPPSSGSAAAAAAAAAAATRAAPRVPCDGRPQKAIVFSQWTSMLDLLEVALRRGGFVWRRLDGTMTLGQRERAIADFEARADVTCLIVSLKAAALGLNLTVANHVVLTDLWCAPVCVCVPVCLCVCVSLCLCASVPVCVAHGAGGLRRHGWLWVAAQLLREMCVPAPAHSLLLTPHPSQVEPHHGGAGHRQGAPHRADAPRAGASRVVRFVVCCVSAQTHHAWQRGIAHPPCGLGQARMLTLKSGAPLRLTSRKHTLLVAGHPPGGARHGGGAHPDPSGVCVCVCVCVCARARLTPC
jgi:SNF2 family DNA or RNA helicase